MTALRGLRGLLLLLPLGACGGIGESRAPTGLAPMGEFRLGYNIAVARKAEKVPISREATAEELETAMKEAIRERFGGYDGRKLYHIGVNVDAYALAPPGVPIVVSPKSVLVISANVWDDSRGAKLHAEPRQFTVWENLTGATAIGSGLTQTKEVQLRNLSRNAAELIQDWMRENPQWFAVDAAEAARLDAMEAAADARAREEARAAGTAIPPNPRPRPRPGRIADAPAPLPEAAAPPPPRVEMPPAPPGLPYYIPPA